MELKIKTAELKQISSDITTTKEEIDTLIYDKFLQIVKKNYIVYDKLEIDQSEEIKEITELITEFDKRIENLAYVLEEKIIPEYSEVQSSIKKVFNENFKNRMYDLLKK